MPGSYEMYALCAGSRTVDWSTRMYLYPLGEPAVSSFFMWVLEGPDGPIVVDTGFTHRLGAQKLPVAGLRTRDELLGAAGVDAERVSDVIVTHLHWDYFDVEGIFPRAVFWVQRDELEFWTSYGAGDRWHQRFLSDCFAEDIASLRSSERLRVIDGTAEMFDGSNTGTRRWTFPGHPDCDRAISEGILRHRERRAGDLPQPARLVSAGGARVRPQTLPRRDGADPDAV